MLVIYLVLGLAFCSRTPARGPYDYTNAKQGLGLQLPQAGRPRLLLQAGAGALTAGAGNVNMPDAGMQPSGASLAGAVGEQPPSIMLGPAEADGTSILPGAGAQVGTDHASPYGGAEMQGTGAGIGSDIGAPASLTLGPQAGAQVGAQAKPDADGATLSSTGAGVASNIYTAPPPSDGMQAAFNGAQNQLSMGATGPTAGPQSASGQNKTSQENDDTDNDGSPASAPESILGGIYDGVPAGGPSEPLVDDGSDGAGPSAAAPVTAQDLYSAYAALILGTGD